MLDLVLYPQYKRAIDIAQHRTAMQGQGDQKGPPALEFPDPGFSGMFEILCHYSPGFPEM